MATQPQKVSLYNVTDLKNATDDAIAPYLTNLPKPYTFRQDHFYTNVRLALGYSAVVIAGVLFYADWKLGWDATKAYTLPACIAYFILNGALSYWVWGVESGIVFVGTRDGGQKLILKSSVQKHKPTYKLQVTYQAPKTGTKWEDREIVGTFTDWFDIHGFLDRSAFRRWMAQNIEVVGLADPESKQIAEQKYAEIVDDVTQSANISNITTPGVGTSADGEPSSGKRKPKKRA